MIFLTGGTGLVGSHLAERLRARGAQVVCLQRPGSDTSFLESLGCRIVRGDVQDSIDDLARAMEGADRLVHGAALIYAGLPWETIHAVNVDGTRRVLEAAVRAGVESAVHLSSVAAYGSQVGRVDESSPTDTALPATDFYARSKREAEAEARRVASAHGLPLTMLRPAAIYGERDRLFAPILARLARLPAVPVFGSGRTSLPVVYAGNVASAAEAALDRPPGARREERLDRGGAGTGVPEDSSGARIAIYNVGQDHPIDTRELLSGFARGLGTRARFVPIPKALVVGGAQMIQRFGGVLPMARDLPVVRAARLTTEDNPYRTDLIREELGWVPPVAHAEGIARTTAWLAGRAAD